MAGTASAEVAEEERQGEGVSEKKDDGCSGCFGVLFIAFWLALLILAYTQQVEKNQGARIGRARAATPCGNGDPEVTPTTRTAPPARYVLVYSDCGAEMMGRESLGPKA